MESIELIKEYTQEDIYIKNPSCVYEELQPIFGQKKEFFIGFYLDSANKIIAREIISIGTLNSSLVHPREVFKSAIIRSANSIILAHNHPGGNLDPSDEDIRVTKVLRDAGELLGIKVIDHLVVTSKGYKSIMEEVV